MVLFWDLQTTILVPSNLIGFVSALGNMRWVVSQNTSYLRPITFSGRLEIECRVCY